MNEAKKIAVSAIDIPWHNIECLGIFDGVKEANKAAKAHIKAFASGEKYKFYPLSGPGSTTGTMTGSDDGFEFLYLEYEKGKDVYVLKESAEGEEILGPYADLDEASDKALPKGCGKRFELTAGTFGPGCYPVEDGEDDDWASYTPIFIYE